MRRIIIACLLQTVRFDTMSDSSPQKEFELYCSKLDAKHTSYVIEEKHEEPDGTLVVKIKKQYNSYKTDVYMD